MHRKKLEQPLYVIISTSIGDLFAGFLTERKSQLLSPKTIRAYTQELTYFSDWLSQHGIQYVNEITAGVIRHYLMDLSERRNPGRCHIAYRVIKTSTFW